MVPLVPRVSPPHRRWRERMRPSLRPTAVTPVAPLVPRATRRSGGACRRRGVRTRCWLRISSVVPLVSRVVLRQHRMCLSRVSSALRSLRSQRRWPEARKRHKCMWLCPWELRSQRVFRSNSCRTCALRRARLRRRFVGWAMAPLCRGRRLVGPLGPRSGQCALHRRHRPVGPLVPRGLCRLVCPCLHHCPLRKFRSQRLRRLSLQLRRRPVVPLVPRALPRCCRRIPRPVNGGGLPGTSRRRSRQRLRRRPGQKRRPRRHDGGKELPCLKKSGRATSHRSAKRWRPRRKRWRVRLLLQRLQGAPVGPLLPRVLRLRRWRVVSAGPLVPRMPPHRR